jgi:hypothetical protein
MTAERDIGSDRNRSMIPLFTSSVMPIAVVAAANTIVWAKIPGMKNCL